MGSRDSSIRGKKKQPRMVSSVVKKLFAVWCGTLEVINREGRPGLFVGHESRRVAGQLPGMLRLLGRLPPLDDENFPGGDLVRIGDFIPVRLEDQRPLEGVRIIP